MEAILKTYCGKKYVLKYSNELLLLKNIFIFDTTTKIITIDMT